MEELKQQIIDLCNESELPLEALLFVTKDVWRDVEDTLRKVKEQTARSKAVQMAQQQEEKEEEITE
jgi:hypothetical protein